MKVLLIATLAIGIAHGEMFSNCTIVSRQSSASGKISKVFDCSGVGVRLVGKWSIKPDSTGVSYYSEFGSFWNGERGDFGSVAASFVRHTYTECNGGTFGSGSLSNFSGYMTQRNFYSCAEGEVSLDGLWGEEFQGHWHYRLELGEVHMTPQWVDDVEKMIDFASFQKYCRTKYGYRLCGWVDEPKVDHGKAPDFKRGIRP